MADEWQVIDDPEDPRLSNTPPNEPAGSGTFDDLLGTDDDLPEVFATQEEPSANGSAGTFDDLKQEFTEAQKVFSGNRGLVLKSLQDYGTTPVVQAAILGDIEQESSFNPTLSDSSDRTGAHGLLQVGNQMWSEFDSAARAAGLTPKDADYVYAQVPYMLDRFKSQHPERWEEMQNASSAADAIEIFRGHPDWGYGIAGKRHAYANTFQNLLANIPPGALMAGEVTQAADEFAQPAQHGNSTFGDLIAEQARQQGKEAPVDVGPGAPIDYRKAAQEDTGEVTPIPEPEKLGEIPELLERTKEEEETKRHRMAGPPAASSDEIPSAYQIKPSMQQPLVIPTAHPSALIGEATGPLIPQGAVAESPAVPSSLPTPQDVAPDLGARAIGGLGDAARQMILPMGTVEDPNAQYPQGGFPEQLAQSFDFPGQAEAMAQEIQKDPLSREAFKQYGVIAATVLPGVGKGVRALRGKAGAVAGEEAAAAAALQPLDLPAVAARWNKMTEAERAQFAGSEKPFEDLSPTDQRAVAQTFAESEAAASPDYQYTPYEKYAGEMPTSTFGAQRARTELQRITPEILLRQKLRAAQRAGQAGYARGSKEAKAAGKLALKQAKMQAKLDAKAEALDIRNTLQTADRWLDADIATVRDKLLSFSKHLPLHERGKLLHAMTSALKKPSAFTRDPAVIKRRAEAVLNRMAEMIYDVNKRELTKEIEKGLNKIINSPAVLISHKQIARNMLNTFNRFKDKMSLDMLEAMRQRMEEVDAMGRDLFHVSKVIQAEATIAALRDIKAQGTYKADLPAQYRLPLEEVPKFWDTWRQNARSVPSFLKHYNFTMDSMDWNFMRFDQRMSGALYRNLKLGIDVRYSEFLDTLDAYQQRRTAIKDKYKLTEQDYRKIAVHAELRQEGGLENLLASGFTKAEVLKYKNEGALTKGQRALLKVDDQINNELYPVLRDTYAQHYNQEIGPKVQGYYPRIRDWEQYNSLSIEEGRFVMGNAVPRRTKTASGMTIQRQQGAVTKNMVDSDVIMNKHLEDVLYTTQLGPEIARVAKIVRSPEFEGQVGSWGQKIFADYVDTLARNGGVESSRRLHVLDTIKKNVGAAQLGFRVTTAFLQPTALLMSIPYSTIRSMSRGITAILDKGNREWILKTFPEVRESIRGGKIDDPAYAVYTGQGIVDKTARVAMAPIRYLDGFARMSAVEAFYRDALEKRGIPFDRNAIPHPEAVAEAQRLVRMTQAGPLSKDASQALTRGEFSARLLGRANVSLDQTMLQFQSYIMNRWSLFKHGALQLGMKEKSVLAGSKVMAYIILASYIEQLGREGIANVWRATFGMGKQEASRVKEEQDKGLAQTITEKAAVDMVTSVPIVSNFAGMVRYDSNGAPVADALTDVVKGSWESLTASKGETRAAGLIRALQAGIGGATGLPTGQIGDLLQRVVRQQARVGSSPVGPYGEGYAFPGAPDLPDISYPDVPTPP